MKKRLLENLCFALASVLVLLLAGCDSPTGLEEKLETKNLTIAGSFDSQNGGSQANFFAKAGSGAPMSAVRAIGSTEYALEGLLEDGDITFRLKGNYNSDTKTYTLSAASSILRYTISGGFNSSGVAETGKAVVQLKSGEVWTTTEAEVTTTGTAPAIDAGGTIVDETEGGIPMNMRGIWRDDGDASYYAMVNAFSVVIYEKEGNNWVESETLYFTEIDVAGGVASGITAYMDWDYDSLPANFSQLMMDDYTAANNIKPYEPSEIINMYQAEFSMTTAGKAIINKYPALNREYKFYSPYNDGSPDSYGYYYDHFYPWLLDKYYAGYYWIIPYGGEGYFYSTDYLDLLLEYRNGDGKTLGDTYGIIIGVNISPPDSDPYGWGNPPYTTFWSEFQNSMDNWLNGQGFVMNVIIPPEYWETWLTDKYGKTSPYWRQWYQKMALKLQGGMLYPGQYVKDGINGSWDEYNNWTPNGTPNPGDFPVWAYTDYNTANSQLNILKWESYGLSR